MNRSGFRGKKHRVRAHGSCLKAIASVRTVRALTYAPLRSGLDSWLRVRVPRACIIIFFFRRNNKNNNKIVLIFFPIFLPDEIIFIGLSSRGNYEITAR